jgi:hypothetical protein
MTKLSVAIIALLLLSSAVLAKDRSSAWHENAHRIAELYATKSDVLQRLGTPDNRVSFAFNGFHKQGKFRLIQCTVSPAIGTNIEGLYYSFEGNEIGYWLFFHDEEMLCFSSRTTLNSLAEWYEP